MFPDPHGISFKSIDIYWAFNQLLCLLRFSWDLVWSLQLPSPLYFISRVSAMVSTRTTSYRLSQKIFMDSLSSNVGLFIYGHRFKSIPSHHLYRRIRQVKEIEDLTYPESSPQ